MQPVLRRLAGVTLGAALGCTPAELPPLALAARAPPRTTPSPPQPTPVAPTPVASAAPPNAPSDPPPQPAPAPSYEPGVFVSVQVAGDAELAVAHGHPSARRAIVYLHGACGDPRAPRAWSSVAAELGTLIALQGDRSCGKNGRHYWGPDTRRLEARVRAALARAGEIRGDAFDASDVVLMGYSQGATRAQELHAAQRERYPRVILAGIPVAPSARHLAGAHAVAILGGQLELTTHMRTGLWALEAHHIPVRFDLFPSAAHGEFGPEAERVMREAFAWLLAQP
ncbi:MAG: hypothetical protein IPI67_26280 [Myxococcales bacterium]|nr:hypothetical protein [Myxococcales bacterium]